MKQLLLALLVGAMSASSAIAQAEKIPQFSQYPATVETARAKAIDFKRSRGARAFRTRLTGALKGGVNFAGHYVLATWGCGTACLSGGIIDGRNGVVYFPQELAGVVDWFVESDSSEDLLTYRATSRLLVVYGTPGTDKRGGKYFYEWKNNRLRLLRFVKQ